MAKTGLQEFKEVISDYKSAISWVVKGAVAAPLADFVLHLGAPWPLGVPVITSVVELIILILTFHFWRAKSQKFLTRCMLAVLVILTVSFGTYLYLFDSYTFVNPATSKRYAKGFVPRSEIERLIPQQFNSLDAALAGAEYKEEDIWTSNSLTAARLALLGTWLTLFGSLAAFLSTFVLAQRKRKVRESVNLKDRAVGNDGEARAHRSEPEPTDSSSKLVAGPAVPVASR
jgi:hypothetical protein